MSSLPLKPDAALQGACRLLALPLALLLLAGCASEVVMGSTAGKQELLRQGRQLDATQLAQLMRPGSAVVRWEPGGYFHRWTNEPDGSIRARTTSSFSWGQGRWAVHDDTYCVRIDWFTKDNGKFATERSCYAIHVLHDKYFYGPSRENFLDGARLGQIQVN